MLVDQGHTPDPKKPLGIGLSVTEFTSGTNNLELHGLIQTGDSMHKVNHPCKTVQGTGEFKKNSHCIQKKTRALIDFTKRLLSVSALQFAPQSQNAVQSCTVHEQLQTPPFTGDLQDPVLPSRHIRHTYTKYTLSSRCCQVTPVGI